MVYLTKIYIDCNEFRTPWLEQSVMCHFAVHLLHCSVHSTGFQSNSVYLTRLLQSHSKYVNTTSHNIWTNWLKIMQLLDNYDLIKTCWQFHMLIKTDTAARAFRVSAPTIWNSRLQLSSSTLVTFKRHLKTFLYRRAFDWPLILRASELSYWQITARYKFTDWLIDWLLNRSHRVWLRSAVGSVTSSH